MKKVIIIGGNGSGKTTMACKLSEKTGIPLVHLDSLYWTDNWRPREREAFDRMLQAELEKPEWILDGNFRRTLPIRLGYCDRVVFLDFSALRCFFGTLGRLLKNLGKSRADMGGECIERLDRRSLKFVFGTLSFNRKNRKYIYSTVAEYPNAELTVLKSRKQVRAFLSAVADGKTE